MVVGAGPAGLEAARLCAMRGHSVRVYEASSRVGGQLEYWTRSPSMKELNRIIKWRVQELDRLGVSIELEKEIAAADLQQFCTDVAIIATGAKDCLREYPVHTAATDGGAMLLTPTQLLDLNQTTAKKSLVINDGRGQAGLVCAEWLLARNVQVEIVTEDVAVANDLDPTNRNAWYERLGLAGATFTPQSVVDLSNADGVHIRNLFSQVVQQRKEIDLIIDWNGCESVNPFAQSGNSGQGEFKMHSIGDCVAPRSVELAMAEALDLAESL